jgi:hypothetical protein
MVGVCVGVKVGVMVEVGVAVLVGVHVLVGVFVGVKVGVLVEVGVGINTVCDVVLVETGTVSLQLIRALLLTVASAIALASTSMVNPQVPLSAGSTFPKFQRIVFPINTPLGTVVQVMVDGSKSSSSVSKTSEPVAIIFPSF